VKTAINNILLMMTIITVNLGIVNLLPLPALDGGRLVFLLIELIFRKPVPAKYEGWVHAAGFVLLMVLMVVIAFSDVLRLVTGKGLGG
jgi:regulator of sigma E protease